jgi:hypothetical protein
MGFWRVLAFAFEAEFLRAPGRLVFGPKRDVYAVISSGVGYWGATYEVVSELVIVYVTGLKILMMVSSRMA